ncbi:MAG TPA: galactose-1-phosphate uridylyltransferase [Streptosporangiaceae bacterium]
MDQRSGPVRHPARLADGREIIYFDATGDAARAAVPDRRDLGESVFASEIRFDPLVSEWVAIAAQRQSRTYHPPADQCPLCPSRDGRMTEIPAPDYDIVVFENRFPSFALAVPEPPPYVDDPLYLRRAGRGRCEVVCFTSDHGASFASLTPEKVHDVMDVWADRTRDLGALPEVAQVFPFENRGEEIGVTLLHPHGQIYGYPFITTRTQRMLGAAHEHAYRTGRNLFDDVVATERRAGTRIIGANDHWVAFVPAAARWPYEVHLYPARRVPDIPALTSDERAAFGPLYLDVLRRFDALFTPAPRESGTATGSGRTPYIAAWQQAPVHEGRDALALHMELFTLRRSADKLKYLAGSESGMGVWINDIPPETAAERLRSAL